MTVILMNDELQFKKVIFEQINFKLLEKCSKILDCGGLLLR